MNIIYRRIETLKGRLADEASLHGCKNVFGGHSINCRCFTIYLSIKKLERMNK